MSLRIGKSAKVTIIFSLIVLFACAIVATSIYFKIDADKRAGTTIAIATDTHVIASSIFTAQNYSEYEDFEKMKHISDAIFKTYVDEIIDSGIKYMIISGDLTENGDEASHLAVAKTLKYAESKGIKVLVINGNHDIGSYNNKSKISYQRFKDIYSDFGYNEAIDSYEGTLSYVADINSDYRLIAIDDIGYYREDGSYKKPMDAEHRLWIYDKVDECNELGKKVIVTAHIPMLNHLPDLYEIIEDKDLKLQNKNLTDFFAKNGVELSIVGHYHFNDIKEKIVKTKDNEEFKYMEIMGASLPTYNTTYRKLRLGLNETEVKTIQMTNVNEAYLPVFLSEEDRIAIKEDYVGYAREYLGRYIGQLVNGIGKTDGMMDIILPESISQFQNLYNIVIDEVVDKLINTPYFIKDEKEGETSMERILSKYKISPVNTEYQYLSEFVNGIMFQIIDGNQNFSIEELSQLVKYTLYEAFYYMDEASDKINAELEALGLEERIDIDLNRLFNKGELECYESGIIPIAITIANNFISIAIVNNILDGLCVDLSIVQNQIVVDAVNGYTDGKLEGFQNYFSDKFIDIEGFVEEGLIGQYIADYIVDSYPNDVEFIIPKTEKK